MNFIEITDLGVNKVLINIKEISEITGTDVIGDSLGQLNSSTNELVKNPNKNEEQQTQTDNNATQMPNEENSNVKGVVAKNGNLIVFTKNNFAKSR